MNYELSNILFVFPFFIEISKNKIFNNTFNNVSGITYNMVTSFIGV